MGTGRFERLERARPANAAVPRPSVEARFGGADVPSPAVGGPDRSGAPALRFEAPEAEERLRVLDTDGGQAFVRCAHCRADNFANATRCSSCATDLLTPAQRAFNETLWRKLQADAAEVAQEAAAVRDRRAAADREHAEAVRRAPELLRELERRRALGLPLDDADDVSSPLRAVGRGLGRFLGHALGRLLKHLVREDARRG
jgi:hypothetical protein